MLRDRLRSFALAAGSLHYRNELACAVIRSLLQRRDEFGREKKLKLRAGRSVDLKSLGLELGLAGRFALPWFVH